MKRIGGAFLVCLAGCGGGTGGDTITLGTVLSQTGSLANIGVEQAQAAQLAVDEINKAGGVLGGSKLALVNKDDGTDASNMSAKGRAAAMDLINAKVPVIFGAIGSQLTLDVATVTGPANVVQISGSSTSPAITTQHATDPYLFRTCPSDALQGKLLANRAKAKAFSKVAIIHLPGAYGVGLADAFQTSFTAQGGTVTVDQEYTEGMQSYVSLLTGVYAGNPEAIVLIAYPTDGAQIIKDYNSTFSAKGTFWYFTDALEDPGFIAGVGASGFTFMHEGTGPGTVSGPRYDAFQAAFTKKYGVGANPGTFSPNVYDAVYLVALAMQASGKSDSASIKGALTGVSAGGTPYGATDWPQAAADAKAGKDINYEGVTGPVDFDASGDVVAPYDIWKIAGGAITVVEAAVTP
jgi:branched-chain amino acid transport system substrate-binding protein